MEFYEGQIFTIDYPEEAAIFCNETGRYSIEKIDNDENGNRRFRLIARPEPTAEELTAIKVAMATSIEARLAALEDALAEMMMEM